MFNSMGRGRGMRGCFNCGRCRDCDRWCLNKSPMMEIWVDWCPMGCLLVIGGWEGEE